MFDLESEDPGSIPTRGNFFSKLYNPNLHNIARSDSLGFKTKNPMEEAVFLKKLMPTETDGPEAIEFNEHNRDFHRFHISANVVHVDWCFNIKLCWNVVMC